MSDFNVYKMISYNFPVTVEDFFDHSIYHLCELFISFAHTCLIFIEFCVFMFL